MFRLRFSQCFHTRDNFNNSTMGPLHKWAAQSRSFFTRQKASLWKLTPWNKRSLGSESKTEETEQTEEWGYWKRPEQEHQGLPASWLALPPLSVHRLPVFREPSAAGPWCCGAATVDTPVFSASQRCICRDDAEAALALIDAFCGTPESKILVSILDQPPRSLLCGRRFMASFSPPLSSSAYAQTARACDCDDTFLWDSG